VGACISARGIAVASSGQRLVSFVVIAVLEFFNCNRICLNRFWRRKPAAGRAQEISITTSFSNLGLAAELLRAVTEQGYNEPTPIQIQAIPLVLEGTIMAGAQTRTGKTLWLCPAAAAACANAAPVHGH
jgi:hypothetical protein